MFTPSTLLQYVRDVATSATFYSGILGKPPVEQSPGFALPARRWRRTGPVAARRRATAGVRAGRCRRTGDGGRQPETVQQMHDAWRGLGVRILLEPVTLEFGHTFVGADPDGHRLRVYSRAEGLVARD